MRSVQAAPNETLIRYRAEGRVYERQKINNFLYDYNLRVKYIDIIEGYDLKALIKENGIRLTDTARLTAKAVKPLVAQAVKPPVSVPEAD
jgi:hypothetical protein